MVRIGTAGAGGHEGGRFGRMWRMARAAVVAGFAVGALGLSGCAAYLNAQVTAFHQPDRSLAGRRFVIEPSNEQRDSLEFKAYADLVRQSLVAHGLIDAVSAGGAADTTVTLRYAIDGGKTVTYAYPAYGYVPVAPSMALTPYRGPDGIVRYAWTPTYPMAYGVVGEHYARAVVYRRELRVELTERGDGASSGGAAPRLYEGTVVSEGESGSLAPVMPAMVRALFADFPGPNGGSRIVRVELEPEPVR